MKNRWQLFNMLNGNKIPNSITEIEKEVKELSLRELQEGLTEYLIDKKHLIALENMKSR